MARGLVDANLGGGLFKKRIGRFGAGKRGGYRVIAANRPGGPWFFIEGYAKNQQETIDAEALDACRELASALTSKSADELSDSVGKSRLKEVNCDA